MPASAAAIWAALADPDSYGFWVVGSKLIRDADPTWPAPGTKFHHTIGIGPFTVNDHTCSLQAKAPSHHTGNPVPSTPSTSRTTPSVTKAVTPRLAMRAQRISPKIPASVMPMASTTAMQPAGIASMAVRVEIGFEMAANAIGTDHHERPDRIGRRRPDHIVIDALRELGGTVLANARGCQMVVAIDDDAVLTRRPAGALHILEDVRRFIGQIREKAAPGIIDGLRILEIAGIKLGDEGGVRAA